MFDEFGEQDELDWYSMPMGIRNTGFGVLKKVTEDLEDLLQMNYLRATLREFCDVVDAGGCI
jgi:hypothetical protein